MKECTFKPKISKLERKNFSKKDTRLAYPECEYNTVVKYSARMKKAIEKREKKDDRREKLVINRKTLNREIAEEYFKPKINKVPNAPKKVIIVPDNNNDIIGPVCAIDSELKKKKADEIRAYLDGIQLTEQTLTKKKEILQKIKAACQGRLNGKDDLTKFDNENVLKQTYYIDDGFEENLLFIGDNAEGIGAYVSKNNHDDGTVVSGSVCIDNGAININNRAVIIIPWIQNRSISKRPKDSYTSCGGLPKNTLSYNGLQSIPLQGNTHNRKF